MLCMSLAGCWDLGFSLSDHFDLYHIHVPTTYVDCVGLLIKKKNVDCVGQNPRLGTVSAQGIKKGLFFTNVIST